MFKLLRALPFAAALGLAACATPGGTGPAQYSGQDLARRFQSIDWEKVARDAATNMAMAEASSPRAYGGIGANRDYTRNWTQTSRAGSCTFFGTGGSICRR